MPNIYVYSSWSQNRPTAKIKNKQTDRQTDRQTNKHYSDYAKLDGLLCALVKNSISFHRATRLPKHTLVKDAWLSKLDGKYSERVQLPAKAKFWGRYNYPWPLLPHPSTDRNEIRTWFSLSPKEASHKIWYKFVHNLFSYRDHRQTHNRQTNAGKNILPRYRGENY